MSKPQTRPLLKARKPVGYSDVEEQPLNDVTTPRETLGESPVKIYWRPPVTRAGLGAFMGVYVPCMLSIIGTILFLRLGWAVGQAGVVCVLGMFAVGGLMAFLTDLSLSAMATNGRIKGGGAYYLISRSVGPGLGGSIGVIFFCANVVGIAFYLQGFTEAVSAMVDLDKDTGSTQYGIHIAMATGVLLVEAAVAIVGAGLYAKCALVVFVIQSASIAYGLFALLLRSPFKWESDEGDQFQLLGPSTATLHDNLWPDFSAGHNTQTVFAIIFPAMTGIMAGSNMSGVLKRPELAIPRGELAALGSALLTYAVMVVVFGACVDRDTLRGDYLVLQRVCWWPGGLFIGIVVSTTSSALASLQSASRLLQAIAADNLIPQFRPFGRTFRGEPVLATLCSVVIAELVVMVGDLNAIAPVLTMFFLVTYATMNLATFLHRVAGHPNFRPRFRFFHWATALVGGLMCLALMFYLQYIATLIALAVMGLLSFYISRRAVQTGWGDVSQSLIFHQVRKYLLRLDERKAHVKFWRPQILFLAPNPQGRVRALEFVNNLKKGGLLVVGDVVVRRDSEEGDEAGGEGHGASGGDGGDGDGGVFGVFAARKGKWRAFVDESRIKAFCEVTVARSLRDGARSLMMTAGLGGMRPNTLLLGFPGDRSTNPSLPVSSVELNSVFDRKSRTRVHCQSTEGWGDDAQTHISDHEFVQILRDAIVCAHITSLLVLRNFNTLDRELLARSNGAGNKRASSRHPPKWAKSLSPHPRDVRHTNPEYSRVDVWDVPWATPESFGLALQLAAMLEQTDFWRSHTYLRVCSVVEKDDKDFTHTRHTYGRLHQQVIRDDRIQARIHVFILSHDAPELYARGRLQLEDERERALAAVPEVPEPGSGSESEPEISLANANADRSAQQHGEGAASGAATAAGGEGGGSAAHTRPTRVGSMIDALSREVSEALICEFIRSQAPGTVVTFLPVPAPPAGSLDPKASADHMARLKQMTEGLGPVVLVQAVQSVIAVDL